MRVGKSIKAYLVSICLLATLFSNVAYVQAAEVYLPQQEMTEYNPLYQACENEAVTGIGNTKIATSGFEEQANTIRQKMQEREETIEVVYDAIGYTQQEVVDSMQNWGREMMREAMRHTGDPQQGDYLKWQYHSWNMKMRGQVEWGGWKVTYTITLDYYTNKEQEKAVTEQVNELLQSLPLEGKQDYEKTELIYDWVCENISYDYEGLADSTNMIKCTAYGALQNRKVVCQGYANLLYRLLNELGIDCRLVSGIGQNQPHAWNIVRLGNYYYNMDATWDAAHRDHRYFLKGSSDFAEHECEESDMEENFWDTHPLSVTNFDPSNLKNEVPSIASEPSQKPSKVSEPSKEPSKVSEPSQEPSKVSEPSKEPSKVSEPSQEPSKVSEPSGEPSQVSEPTQEPGKVSEPSQEPSKVSEPSKEPSKVSEPSQEPSKVSEPSGEPSQVSEPDKASEPGGEPQPSQMDEPTQPNTHVHSYQRQITRATVEADGKIVDICECGDKVVIQKIVYPKKIVLGYTSFAYTGTVVHPPVKVLDRRGEEIAQSNYRITYSRGCTNVGVYKVRVTFLGNYTGVMYTTFTVKPPATRLKICANSATAVKVQWTRQNKQVQGYQIQYSVTPTFRTSSSRTINITDNTTKRCVIRGKGAYYIRIRTYQIVSNQKIYSDWSNRCKRP